MSDATLDELVTRIRSCTVCAHALPLGPRPVLHVSPRARVLIASQAPGTKVHETGISFNDASGDRLRQWLDMDRDTFYDTEKVALVPMGFCYPGRLPKGGDCPPRPECAPLWREQVLSELHDIQLTLLVGSYAQNYVLGPGRVSDRVAHFRDYLPRYFPLPHPSWRTGAWEKRNPWFGEDVLPALRQDVARILGQ
ncbi:uracil-DNA glycosylase family protein [Acetobacter sp.]|jgi:uracil-DNA glycosylase|uniref:uracil-DNA glycosylase family protein n=1 Tax=Acetobacter sp. TaxID=440 RepID=UPI0025C72C13|nr:uracil-DNA glycosylase family protein [Acetobacter sp.]MCH4090468.1 uracil-DNA glycosylase family protein [Acetobacter sp.]MCI1299162.1 uracil-DNA glycosylase family protein [Acetobacter sp.]MCI1315709.1 uracil-DNA glycosylase family protein [Acetobacter sp.]